jgi:hypothetical protein
MSFDMAVWEGVRPSTDAEGLAEFNRLHARSLEGGASVEPSARMKKFIAAITEKYPDIVDLPDDLVDDGVWSDGRSRTTRAARTSTSASCGAAPGRSRSSSQTWPASMGSCASTRSLASCADFGGLLQPAPETSREPAA